MRERLFSFVFGNYEEITPLNVIKEVACLDPAIPLDEDEIEELVRWYYNHIFMANKSYYEEVKD